MIINENFKYYQVLSLLTGLTCPLRVSEEEDAICTTVSRKHWAEVGVQASGCNVACHSVSI